MTEQSGMPDWAQDAPAAGQANSTRGAVPDWAQDAAAPAPAASTLPAWAADTKSQNAAKPPASIADPVTPIGDAAPDFGEGKIQPSEMETAGKEFRRLGGIAAQSAESRALNLGATLHQGLNPGESIAASIAGLPSEYTAAGQLRAKAKEVAPRVLACARCAAQRR